jgi:hypothetical protein
MSDFLFSTPSIIEGVGRIFDFSGSMQAYNESATPEQADALAIFNDFKAVGLDIRNAAEQLERETVPAN